MEHFRMDQEHCNAFAAWKRMGSPQNPRPEQYAELEKAGQLTAISAAEKIQLVQGKATVRLELPRQGVSLVKVSW